MFQALALADRCRPRPPHVKMARIGERKLDNHSRHRRPSTTGEVHVSTLNPSYIYDVRWTAAWCIRKFEIYKIQKSRVINFSTGSTNKDSSFKNPTLCRLKHSRRNPTSRSQKWKNEDDKDIRRRRLSSPMTRAEIRRVPSNDSRSLKRERDLIEE